MCIVSMEEALAVVAELIAGHWRGAGGAILISVRKRTYAVIITIASQDGHEVYTLGVRT